MANARNARAVKPFFCQGHTHTHLIRTGHMIMASDWPYSTSKGTTSALDPRPRKHGPTWQSRRIGDATTHGRVSRAELKRRAREAPFLSLFAFPSLSLLQVPSAGTEKKGWEEAKQLAAAQSTEEGIILVSSLDTAHDCFTDR